ncbi:MAG: mannose-1-phosphate guanylyltransferase/mannose-6-phosphate isomerase [SAR202 cluster bacterium]|nr:mannose-1-phosphate guanylyltransferase/mannose-6-phosphate isomerase [SAR202 cluster bacterium]
MALQPVVLCGGAGTRLWPLSTQARPKQFIPLVGRRTLYQQTLLRLRGLRGVNAPIIVCNRRHRALALDQARDVGVRPCLVALEPMGRNTAPALTLAALLSDPDDSLLVMPADHVIKDTKAFQRAVKVGASLAASGHLVTFGIVPTGPNTGYGYILKGKPLSKDTDDALNLSSFVEKPDLPTAESYVNSGKYLWNSGIFFMASSTWLAEIQRHRPDILAACRQAVDNGRRRAALFRPHEPAFSACPSDSIDYAVMEKAPKCNGAPCAVVPLDVGWSDLGSWQAVWEARDKDTNGNAVEGDVVLEGVKDSLVLNRGGGRVALVGLEGVVVIETEESSLVAGMERAQEVRKVAERARKGRK